MADKDDFKTIRVISFTNEKEDWYEWSLKFRCMAEERGYEEIIDGSVTPPDDSVDLSTITDTAQKDLLTDARKAIKRGYRDLTLAMKGISLLMVGSSKTTELPKGDLKMAWGKLEAKWDPKQSEDKADLIEKFRGNKLTDTRTDPKDWLARLEKQRHQLEEVGHVLSDDDWLIHIMLSLPEEYFDVVRDMKRMMRTNSLTIDETTKLLEDKYKLLKRKYNWDDEEMALASINQKMRNNNSNGQKKQSKGPFKKRFKGSCSNCGRLGHPASKRWMKEENKSLRPKGWQPKPKTITTSTKKPKFGANRGRNGAATPKIFNGACFKCGGPHRSSECPSNADEANTTEEQQHHVMMAWYEGDKENSSHSDSEESNKNK
ncbi:hypothetical protein ACA910_003271 [Epithemia clementina (nom. ined.)]